MTNIECLRKAETRLAELYGDNSRITARFLAEKRGLEEFKSAKYFDKLAKLCRESMEKNNKKLVAKFPTACCFTAYLLDASDINPLPLHYYCPKCKRVEWVEEPASLFDMSQTRTCKCGAQMRIDGYGIPYETYLPYAKTAESKPPVPESCDGLNEALVRQHLQLAILDVAQACHLLGQATDVYPDEVELCDEDVKCRLLDGDFSCADEKLYLIGKFLTEMYKVVKPSSYAELLKLIGLGQGTNTWRNNAEELIQNGRCGLSDIPATRDEVLMRLLDAMKKQNVDDAEFALEVTEKARSGYYFENGMDSQTEEKLRKLGLGEWFVTYLSRVRYMSAKARSVLNLKHVILLTWYQTYHPQQYAKVVGETKIWNWRRKYGIDT